jgi:hypothetical protein
LVDLDSIVEIKSPFVPRNTDIRRLAANWPSGETAAAKRHRPNPYVIDPMAPKIKCMVGGNHLIDPLFIDLDLHVLPALENIRPLHQIIFQQDE